MEEGPYFDPDESAEFLRGLGYPPYPYWVERGGDGLYQFPNQTSAEHGNASSGSNVYEHGVKTVADQITGSGVLSHTDGIPRQGTSPRTPSLTTDTASSTEIDRSPMSPSDNAPQHIWDPRLVDCQQSPPSPGMMDHVDETLPVNHSTRAPRPSAIKRMQDRRSCMNRPCPTANNHDKGFGRPADLKRHEKTHHRAATFLYYCTSEVKGKSCAGFFARLDLMKRHCRKKHENVESFGYVQT